MKYRKMPVVVEAWPVRELNRAARDDWKALPKCIRDAYEKGGWIFGCGGPLGGGDGIEVPTLEGHLWAAPDDWVIRGVAGEFYPCKPDIFAATYEPAPDKET